MVDSREAAKARRLANAVENLSQDEPWEQKEALVSEICGLFDVRQERITWGRQERYKQWSDGSWCAPYQPLWDLNDVRLLAIRAGVDPLVPLSPRRATVVLLRAFAASREQNLGETA